MSPVNLKQFVEGGKKTRFKKGHIGYTGMKGRKQSAESRKKMSEAKLKKPTRYWLGKKRPGLGKIIGDKLRGRKVPLEVRKKIGRFGARNHAWKGGISNINLKIRGSLKYVVWREKVFKRDDYTCRKCLTRGGRLHAHHIKPFALFPRLRFSVKNGLTLCVPCHKKEHLSRWG